jgi:tetratricopeptide (TPR) repeat protein
VLRLAASLTCLTLVAAIGAGAAQAQKKKKKDKAAPAAGAPPDAAPQPSGPPPPTPEQKQKATAAFQAGQEAEKAGNLDEAIAKYEEAFGVYPDPVLQLVLGEAHRKKADQAMQGEGYAQAVPEYEKAKAAYEKYLELAPQGKEAEAARNRIQVATVSLDNAKKALEKQKADEAKDAEREAEAAKKAEEERRREQEAATGMQLALDGLLIAGIDQDVTAVARFMPGGMLGWGRFALEGHLSFEGFLRISNDKGVSARSVSLDLGARYGFKSNRFVGPFVSGGGGFGLFGGIPRERKLDGDMATCGAFEGGRCAFSIDKNISTRLGFGYGFEASRDTTVAVRLDAMYWFFSVDNEQDMGAPAAGQVDKPQTALAVLLGLEFLHWP